MTLQQDINQFRFDRQFGVSYAFRQEMRRTAEHALEQRDKAYATLGLGASAAVYAAISLGQMQHSRSFVEAFSDRDPLKVLTASAGLASGLMLALHARMEDKERT